jgi:PQQ-like domain
MRTHLNALVALFVITTSARADMVTQFQVNAAHTGAVSDSVNPASITPSWTVTASSLGVQSLVPGVVGDGSNVYFTAYVSNSTTQGFFENYAVFAVNQVSGGTAWEYGHTTYFTPASAPSILGGVVYSQFGGNSTISGGTQANWANMVGLRAANGQQIFATPYASQFTTGNQPTISGNQVFGIAGVFGGMQGYNASTGATQWFAQLPQQVQLIPAADASNLYIYFGIPGGGSKLYAINQVTGAIAYTIPDPLGFATPTNANVVLGNQNDALVHGALTSASGDIISFDLSNQAIRWRVDVNATGDMAVVNGKVYVPSGDAVFIYDEASGKLLGQMTAGSGVNLTSNTLVTSNVLFVSSATETYGFDLTTLAELWSVNDGGQLSWENGTLLISNSSSVSAFNSASVPETSPLILSSLGISIACFVVSRRRQFHSRWL